MEKSELNEETEETSILALRKENKELKMVLQRIEKLWKLREIEHMQVLTRCSMGLRQAAAQLERQNQIIQNLKKVNDEKNAQTEMPDSTT